METGGRIPIRAIKHSERVCLLCFGSSGLSMQRLLGLLEALAQREISIPFLLYTRISGVSRLSLSFSEETASGASVMAEKFLGTSVIRLSDERFISVFPHHSRTSMIGAFICSLDKSAAGLHCLATSMSTINIAVSTDSLGSALDGLTADFALPEGHTPMYTAPLDQATLQTIAVYNEARIKTYGFSKESGLSLVRLEVPTEHCGVLGDLLKTLPEEARFRLAIMQPYEERMTVFLLAEPSKQEILVTEFRSAEVLADMEMEVTGSVGLIQFQGPHYGERYGIAETMVRALQEAEIDVMAVECCTQSIHVIVAEDRLAAATAALSEVFEVPFGKKRS